MLLNLRMAPNSCHFLKKDVNYQAVLALCCVRGNLRVSYNVTTHSSVSVITIGCRCCNAGMAVGTGHTVQREPAAPAACAIAPDILAAHALAA